MKRWAACERTDIYVHQKLFRCSKTNLGAKDGVVNTLTGHGDERKTLCVGCLHDKSIATIESADNL